MNVESGTRTCIGSCGGRPAPREFRAKRLTGQPIENPILPSVVPSDGQGVNISRSEDGPGAQVPPPRRTPLRRDPIEGNARLTASTAVVLLVLLAAEGVTILQVGRLITPHVFIGMVLVPPILLKMGSTFWKFARYYLGAPAYRQKGPPLLALRLLGPLVVILTLTVIASGIALLLGPFSWRSSMLSVHKISFILWLGVMALHVLGHLLDTARLAPRDWLRHTRRQVSGASLRQWSIAASIAFGLILAVVVVPRVGPWLVAGSGR